jgi:hypothetical protein
VVSFDRRYCSLIGLRIDLSKVVAVEFGAPGRVSGQGHPARSLAGMVSDWECASVKGDATNHVRPVTNSRW